MGSWLICRCLALAEMEEIHLATRTIGLVLVGPAAQKFSLPLEMDLEDHRLRNYLVKIEQDFRDLIRNKDLNASPLQNGERIFIVDEEVERTRVS